MSNRIYNVRQAAKILGLSTNTTYKYLREGRIKSSRGHVRGTFIIPAKSLEDFLGAKLPDDALPKNAAVGQDFFASPNADAEAVIEVNPPVLAVRVIRGLLLLSLIAIIADLLLSRDFSPVTQITRVLVVAIFLLVAYQFGGFIKK